MNQPTTKALDTFALWSNYLLVTTVAAAGWVASGNVRFTSRTIHDLVLWCLGISIIFGILALAAVPLVAQELRRESTSIYKTRITFNFLGIEFHAYLTQACRPQHISFMLAMLLYVVGTTKNLLIGGLLGVAASVYGVLSRPTVLRPQLGDARLGSVCVSPGAFVDDVAKL